MQFLVLYRIFVVVVEYVHKRFLLHEKEEIEMDISTLLIKNIKKVLKKISLFSEKYVFLNSDPFNLTPKAHA